MVAQIDAAYRHHGRGRVLRRLASYALFEGRPATTRGQWFNPAVFAWLRALAVLPGHPRIDRPVFITGLGRSGTTILGLLLSVHRDVGFLNEPKALWHVIDPRQDVNGNYAAGVGRYRLGAADVTPVLGVRAHRLFGRYLASVGARRVVDKYPELVFRIPYVRAIFPDARFIFISRNGVDACQSIVRWSERLGRGAGNTLEDWWGRSDSKWHMLWRQLVETDPDCADVAALGRDALDHANRAAVEWALTMREGLRQVQAAPDVVVPVRYEDLLADPDGELQRLQSICGLEPDPAVVAYARDALHENPAKPMPSLLPPVQRLFDETMAQMGYGARA